MNKQGESLSEEDYQPLLSQIWDEHNKLFLFMSRKQVGLANPKVFILDYGKVFRTIREIFLYPRPDAANVFRWTDANEFNLVYGCMTTSIGAGYFLETKFIYTKGAYSNQFYTPLDPVELTHHIQASAALLRTSQVHIGGLMETKRMDYEER